MDRRAIPAHAAETRWEAADGHAIRRIDWPTASGVPARGSILFVPGRGDFYEKYLESLEEWHQAGWRVTAIDWRGQSGSGRLGRDEITGHVDDFGTWIADLKHFWQQWAADMPGPHVLIGHSMGGHLALRAVADGAATPDAVVLSAPMLGFDSRLPDSVMQAAARLMAAMGDPTRPAWKWSEKPGEVPANREHLLTHDADRYADELFWRRERPELAMGPGSWGWVERAYASMRGLFEAGRLEVIGIPVLVLATSNDKLVGYGAIQEAVMRLPDAELYAFGIEAHHELLREVDPVRDRAMQAIADFFARKLPKGGDPA